MVVKKEDRKELHRSYHKNKNEKLDYHNPNTFIKDKNIIRDK